MPKRKERMAGYIRESDPNLADSTTIESQAKAVCQYGEKEHYIYEPQHEYREALSAYTIPYMQRPQLLKMLKAAERREFDVLVVSEVRAISRRQIEVLIIFDMLQKWGVRLETVKEKFADDAMGKAVLALRAMFVEIEREQSKIRMDRGRADRIAVGKAPNGHPKPAYGYILVDTKVEVKGRYELNHEIVYTDANDKSWSRVDVCLFIFHLLKRGGSLHKTAHALNDMGIPAPRGGIGEWTATTILLIVNNPIYTGEVYANRFKQIEKRIGKSGKPISKMIERPKEEWIRLPDAPAIIDKETALAVQRQLQINKLESLRNNKQKELGLLRSGYIFCGICGRRMSLVYPSNNAPASATPSYHCTQRHGKSLEIIRNHKTQIHLPYIDAQAKEKIVEVLLHPEVVRAKVAELREAIKPVFDAAHIKETVENIRRAMKNLLNLAQNATDDETMAELTQRMNNLEKQKRDAESMLHDLEEAGEERVELEAELVKFEKWVEDVRPLLTDPTYMETASYGELRIAIRILGLRCTVYPTQGGWPYRYHIEVTVPEVLKKVYCVQMRPCI